MTNEKMAELRRLAEACPDCGRPRGGSLAGGQCIISGGDACRLNTIAKLRAEKLTLLDRIAELERR